MIQQLLDDCNSALLKKFYNDFEREEFYLRHVSEEFVLKELSQLNPYKSTGLGEIPARFLKEGAPFLKTPVPFLVNTFVCQFLITVYLMA